MEKKILFRNNISDIGKIISRNLSYFNFKVSYCNNNYSNILNNLQKCDFDGLFFFVMYDSDELCSFMKNLRREFPYTRVYPIAYEDSEILKEKLLHYGAEKCFTLPMTSEELCFSVIYDFFFDDEIMVSIEIADFLIKNNFPYHVNGFYFLCICMEMVIDNPNLFTNFSKLLYPSVKERTGSSVAWIERSIRNLSKIIYNNGVRFENYPDDKKLTNKTLVKAVVEKYCMVNNIKIK